MTLKVNREVFAASADGVIVFLDLARDRYCALNRSWSARALAGDDAVQDRLQRAHLCGGVEKPFTLTEYAPARIGAHSSGQHMTMASITAVMIRRAQAGRSLRKNPISSVVSQCQQRKAMPGRQGDVRSMSDQFCAAEVLVRREGDCLRRALALLMHLGSHARDVDWVFGVTGAPFSAHCWLQQGDVVLNDTIENTHLYTPIMIA